VRKAARDDAPRRIRDGQGKLSLSEASHGRRCNFMELSSITRSGPGRTFARSLRACLRPPELSVSPNVSIGDVTLGGSPGL
jgi:hypothetical protein